MADIVQFNPVRAWLDTGLVAAGARAYFYESGTTTPLTVYSDNPPVTPHATPVVADSTGRFPGVYYDGGTSLKVVVRDANDVILYTIDPVLTFNSGLTGAANISFSATVENPNSDVQSAIEASMTAVVQDTTPQLGGPLDTNSHQVRWSKGADVASAAALSLGADGNYFDVTGAATITSIGTLGAGALVLLHFDSTPTLTHHATNLVMPGGESVTAKAGDEASFVEYEAGKWRCVSYISASNSAAWDAGTETQPSIPSPAKILAATKKNSTFYREYMLARDIKATGLDGGPTTASTWTKRSLPASPEVNKISGASVAASVLTLPDGEYMIHALCPQYQIGFGQARLRNTTDSVTQVLGSSIASATTSGTTSSSIISGTFTVSGGPKTFEIQHWASNTVAAHGLGRAANSGESEIYTILEIWRL